MLVLHVPHARAGTLLIPARTTVGIMISPHMILPTLSLNLLRIMGEVANRTPKRFTHKHPIKLRALIAFDSFVA